MGDCTECGTCDHICHLDNRADYSNSRIEDKIDANGYLRVKGTFTRAGVFSYRQPDGSFVKEFRPPEEVFKADSMNTLKMIPLAPVDAHERTMQGVAPANDIGGFTHLGVTGENLTRTPDDCIDGALTVYDKATIEKAIEAERSGTPLQLSAAYKVGALENKPGEYKGEKYDKIQRNIVYGHVTLVERGRAGSRCHMRADKAQDATPKKEEKFMLKITVPALEAGSGENLFRADKMEVEETPDVLKLMNDRERIFAELKTVIMRADRAEGKVSALKDDNEALKKEAAEMIPKSQYRGDMKESLELIVKAKEIGLDPKDDVTPKALKIGICEAFNPKFDKVRADQSEEFLAGAYGEIENDWKYRVSRLKTDQSINHFKQQKSEVSETEIEETGV